MIVRVNVVHPDGLTIEKTMIYLLIFNWQGAVKIWDVQRQVWYLLYEWAHVSSLTLFKSKAVFFGIL